MASAPVRFIKCCKVMGGTLPRQACARRVRAVLPPCALFAGFVGSSFFVDEGERADRFNYSDGRHLRRLNPRALRGALWAGATTTTTSVAAQHYSQHLNADMKSSASAGVIYLHLTTSATSRRVYLHAKVQYRARRDGAVQARARVGRAQVVNGIVECAKAHAALSSPSIRRGSILQS